MKIKGISELRQSLPDDHTRRSLIRIGLLLAGVFLLVTIFFTWVDGVFPEWMPDGEIIFIALGFLFIALFYSQKGKYQTKFGDSAYSLAISRFLIPGWGILFASIAHLIYIPGPVIPNLWWKIFLTIAGWVLILIGAVLYYRSVMAIGVDYLAMLYVYFPENSRLNGSNIYCLLRHPIYASLLDFGMGIALVSGNWYSLLVALLLPLGFTGWIRLVEEKELLQRFGQEYVAYRKNTPAFWIKLGDIFKFARILLKGH